MVGDGCLENGCVVVQDVEAEWSRSEEGESLDQSLSLKQHPTSLEKLLVQPFSLSLFVGTCSLHVPFLSFQQTTRNTLITLRKKIFLI